MTDDQADRLLQFIRELAHEDRAAAERLLRHFLGLPPRPHRVPARDTDGPTVMAEPSAS